jgi:hypothetical protein
VLGGGSISASFIVLGVQIDCGGGTCDVPWWQ